LYVRLIPQDSRALHLELFTVPSTLTTFCEVIIISLHEILDPTGSQSEAGKKNDDGASWA
jgi:hypothetical protein